ncbi:ABC transporter substrate-binding protein [Caproiciproducens faecalis]|uniref:ABC transporter substrate-binding protein n=1 Tax=Caproiciproducens faecalis TaxID=2820301 RepID=UPI002107B840|nr:ABC transporter substrate-binding protein [Caproiciproducens faecalis]
MCLLCGCGKIETNSVKSAPSPSSAASAVTFTDDLGYQVTLEHPQKTAVLSASYADAWQLAGGTVSAYTDDAKGTIEIKDGMLNLGKLNTPNMESMIANKIDFVILSGTISEHVKLRETLESAGIKTAYFKVETFEDYGRMMKILTDITGREDLYQKNVAELQAEIRKQTARADGSNPTVLFLRAYSTGVKAKGSDSMTGKMLKDLGCVNIADQKSSLLDDLSMEAIVAADPDFIFVTTMGESQKAALGMVNQLLISNPAWSGLTAVKENRYYVLPKELFHLKPNNRWGESYQILADDLYGKK